MEKGGLNCFSFFLLVLGTVPRIFNSRQALCVSSPFFFSCKVFDYERDLTELSRQPLGLWQSHSGLLAWSTRPAALWALEDGRCSAYLPPFQLAPLLSREASERHTSWSAPLPNSIITHSIWGKWGGTSGWELTVCEGQQTFACLLSSALPSVYKASFPICFSYRTVIASITDKVHTGLFITFDT